jgi:hypothetical protein
MGQHYLTMWRHADVWLNDTGVSLTVNHVLQQNTQIKEQVQHVTSVV